MGTDALCPPHPPAGSGLAPLALWLVSEAPHHHQAFPDKGLGSGFPPLFLTPKPREEKGMREWGREEAETELQLSSLFLLQGKKLFSESKWKPLPRASLLASPRELLKTVLDERAFDSESCRWGHSPALPFLVCGLGHGT